MGDDRTSDGENGDHSSKRLSLRPLTFEEALEGLLATPPEPKRQASDRAPARPADTPKRPRKRKGDQTAD